MQLGDRNESCFTQDAKGVMLNQPRLELPASYFLVTSDNEFLFELNVTAPGREMARTNQIIRINNDTRLVYVIDVY